MFQRVRCDASNCVEVDVTPEATLLRSSTSRDEVLTLSSDEWDAFKVAIKEGQFDQ
jgi:hypothetical protein